MEYKLEYWKTLTSFSWGGHDELAVFCEFVDVMFSVLVNGIVDYDDRPFFKHDRERKLKVMHQAMQELGDEMERRPFRDLLGPVHQDIAGRSSRQNLGSFYTPDEISDAMAAMTMSSSDLKEKVERGEVVSVSDPAVGSARTLLSMAKQMSDHLHLLRCHCVDIELIACKMAFINLSLWDIPAIVIHGDSMQLKTYNAWITPHLVRIQQEEKRDEAFRRLFAMIQPDGSVEEVISSVPEPSVEPSLPCTQQLEFNFS